MNKTPFMKLFISLSIILAIIALSGCENPGAGDFTAWTHTVVVGNYTGSSAPYTYRITDARFNTDDWYDIWIDDPDPLGWSSFEGIFDWDELRFYYEPVYYDGYMEWYALSDTHNLGQTLRIYQRKHP